MKTDYIILFLLLSVSVSAISIGQIPSSTSQNIIQNNITQVYPVTNITNNYVTNITNNITINNTYYDNITEYFNITNNITEYFNITNNITEYFNITENITQNISFTYYMTSISWYLTAGGNTSYIDFNETLLNITALNVCSIYNDTSYIDNKFGTLDDNKWCIGDGGKVVCEQTPPATASSVSNLDSKYVTIGNWSLDKSSYLNSSADYSQDSSLIALNGNWSLDKSSYNNITDDMIQDNATIKQIAVLNDSDTRFRNLNISANITITGGNISVNGEDYTMSSIGSIHYFQPMVNDFIQAVYSTSGVDPFGSAVISAGSGSLSSFAYVNNIGTLSYSSNSTGRGGFIIGGMLNTLLLSGGEKFTGIIRPITTLSGTGTGVSNITNVEVGFIDHAGTPIACVDGVYFNITNSSVIGTWRLNGVNKNVTSAYKITANTFYRFQIIMNSTTSATLTIINGTDNTILNNNVLFSDTPFTSTKESGIGVKAWLINGTASTTILEIDYMKFEINRYLLR